MPDPKFRRRKQARPREIVKAALDLFAERGFAATRLDDIAERAGVSKGTLYLYFPSKEALFEAVVTQSFASNIDKVRMLVELTGGRIFALLPMLPPLLGKILKTTPAPAILKMVVGESRNFPALARTWHDTLVAPLLDLLTDIIARAQARGEIHPGDPRLYALQLIGPGVLGLLWKGTLEPVGAEPVDLETLLSQHIRTFLRGALVDPRGLK